MNSASMLNEAQLCRPLLSEDVWISENIGRAHKFFAI